jgi:hypothetical protein
MTSTIYTFIATRGNGGLRFLAGIICLLWSYLLIGLLLMIYSSVFHQVPSSLVLGITFGASGCLFCFIGVITKRRLKVELSFPIETVPNMMEDIVIHETEKTEFPITSPEPSNLRIAVFTSPISQTRSLVYPTNEANTVGSRRNSTSTVPDHEQIFVHGSRRGSVVSNPDQTMFARSDQTLPMRTDEKTPLNLSRRGSRASVSDSFAQTVFDMNYAQQNDFNSVLPKDLHHKSPEHKPLRRGSLITISEVS